MVEPGHPFPSQGRDIHNDFRKIERAHALSGSLDDLLLKTLPRHGNAIANEIPLAYRVRMLRGEKEGRDEIIVTARDIEEPA